MKKNTSKARLDKEFKDIASHGENADVKAQLVQDNYKHWKGIIKGPEDGPYAGGMFVVNIDIPEAYPFEPPKMKFDTKVWHPNVSSQTGAICLDILKNEYFLFSLIKQLALFFQALPLLYFGMLILLL